MIGRFNCTDSDWSPDCDNDRILLPMLNVVSESKKILNTKGKATTH